MYNRLKNWSLVWMLTAGCVLADPRISEFMAANDTGRLDEDGETSDWIEIHNPETGPLPMAGYHLTDSAGNLTKWTFPAITLAADEYRIVFASNKDRRDPGGELHTNFKLDAGGEYLALVAPDGTNVISEFSPAYAPQFEDVSFGFGEAGAAAQTDLAPVWNHPANYSNVKLTGAQTAVEDGGADSLDLDSPGPQTQQYMWFDFSSALSAIAPGSIVQSASLRWSGSVSPSIFGMNTVASPLGVFPVPGANHGIDTVAASFTSSSLVDYYAAHTPVSAFTAVPGQTPVATWDIRTLVQDWMDQPGAPRRGELMILNGNHPLHMDWDQDGNNRPLLTATVTTLAGTNAATRWVYFDTPTPGAANSGGQEAGPIFGKVTKHPPQPVSGPLTLTAELTGSVDPVADVTLYYREGFGPETMFVMRDDGLGGDLVAGDGRYAAVIPGSAITPGEMTRWRYLATDTAGHATREPPFRDPVDSHEYYGTVGSDPAVTSRVPVVHWFIDNPSGAEGTGGAPGALYYQGEFYDNVFFNRHGQSTGGFVKKSFNLDFNRTQRFRWHPDEPRVADIDLITNWADKSKVRHVLGYEIMRESGVHAHFAFTVRVEQNGAFYSTADFIEDADDIYLKRAGLNEDGALYKAYSNRLNKDAGDTASNGFEKKTRESEDHADLQALIDGLDLTGTALSDFMYDHIDLPKCVNLLAANSVIRNIDMHSKNWYIYRDTGRTDEWAILPWDLDLSAGRLWTPESNYFDNNFYTHGYVRTAGSIRLVARMYGIPAMRAMVNRRVRTLSDRFLQPESTPPAERWYERRLDEQSALIDPPDLIPSDAQRDFEKWGSWVHGGNGAKVAYTSTHPDVESMAEGIQRLRNEYLPARRNEIYNNQTVGNGGEIPSPQGNPMLQFGAIEFSPSTGNQDEEYLALMNPNAFAVDISDWEIKRGVEFTFQPGTVLAAGQTLYVSPDVTAFRARATSPTGGESHFVQGGFRGHLSSFGETLVLLDAAGATNTITTYTGNPSAPQLSLVVSEIMYHPTGDGLAEYIELMNISDSIPLDLNGVHFTAGISFAFTGSSATNLAPGERVLVVRDQAAFEAVHGTNLNIAGAFTLDSALNNGGEFIKLEDALNGTIKEFEYDNQAPWPEAADGLGYSLVLIDPRSNPDPDQAASWRSSTLPGGNPETSDALAAPLDPTEDVNGNQIPDLLDYAFGNALGPGQLRSMITANGVELEHPVSLGADAILIAYEITTDFTTWTDVTDQVLPAYENLGDGRARVSVPLAGLGLTDRAYARLRISLR